MAPLATRTPSPSASRWSDDAGVVLLTTLVKTMLVLAVIGACGYDAISMLTTQLQVTDHAQQAALAGRDALSNRGGTQAKAYQAVLAYAEENGDEVVPGSFKVGKDRSVTVTLTGTAPTLVAKHLPKVQDYVVTTYTATATDPIR